MKKLTLLLLLSMISVSMTFAQKVSKEESKNYAKAGIENSYWYDKSTGDWIIGFTSEGIIYDTKIWNIVRKTNKKDKYEFTISNHATGELQKIKVGKLKKGERTITLKDKQSVNCMPITTKSLPAYPNKDTRTGFRDTGYHVGDSVTLVGLVKNMPDRISKIKHIKDIPEKIFKDINCLDISYFDFISDNEPHIYAKMDSLGRFSIKFPLLNSSQVYLSWGATLTSSVMEPGETYFFLFDTKTDQKLFMGKNCRIQNELIANPHLWSNISGRETKDAMKFLAMTDSVRNISMEELKATVVANPNISQRYIDYLTGYYRYTQATDMMQGRFYFRELPKQYMDFVYNKLWKNPIKPYTLYREFSFFTVDYIDQLITEHENNVSYSTKDMILQLEKKGLVTLNENEKKIIDSYLSGYNKTLKLIKSAKTDDEKTAIVKEFNSEETVKNMQPIFEKVIKPLTDNAILSSLTKKKEILDSIRCDKTLNDLLLARNFYKKVNSDRTPLDSVSLDFSQRNIELTYAKNRIKELNDKYQSIQNIDINSSTSLRSPKDVEGLTDGEQILRKIVEPFKGRNVYLDIWGTWCGPCKEDLSISKEIKEALKEYDFIYLYLASGSSEEGWKNVIKEYNLTGENCIHYNLPQEQQNAIEQFLKLREYPTYRIIDKGGNIHNIKWFNAYGIEELNNQIKMINSL